MYSTAPVTGCSGMSDSISYKRTSTARRQTSNNYVKVLQLTQVTSIKIS